MSGSSRSVNDLVSAAKQKVENLSPDDVQREMQEGAVLIDLRESEEVRQHGAIPGAVHMPRGMLEWYADASTPYHRKELDASKRVILHCAGGGRSALAADTLQQMGYGSVAHLEGGFKAWKEAGKPVQQG